MLSLRLDPSLRRPPRILCLGSHSDDIEIGCGGTLLKLLAVRPAPEVHWIVFSADGERVREAQRSAALFLRGVKKSEVVVQDFRNGFFPYQGTQIKEYFEALKLEFSPDVIFTHYRHDLHQDHRTICDLTWNTFRNHFILEYEIPKYDGDLGVPNCFVPLSEGQCRKKIAYILRSFCSQAGKHWFTEDVFRALLRLRGLESASPTRFAEAFYCRKMVL